MVLRARGTYDEVLKSRKEHEVLGYITTGFAEEFDKKGCWRAYFAKPASKSVTVDPPIASRTHGPISASAPECG